jgi:anti-sigma factor RsiW
MDCREYRRLASQEADGALDAAGHERLELHTASCAACARFREVTRAAVSIHRSIPDVAPPGTLVSRIVAAATAERSRPGLSVWIRVALPAAAAATAVLGIWIGGMLTERLASADMQSQADVLELQYLNEYPPGSVGELLMASNGGGADEGK